MRWPLSMGEFLKFDLGYCSIHRGKTCAEILHRLPPAQRGIFSINTKSGVGEKVQMDLKAIRNTLVTLLPTEHGREKDYIHAPQETPFDQI